MQRRAFSLSFFRKPHQGQVAEEAAGEVGAEIELERQQMEVRTKANQAGRETRMEGGAAGHDKRTEKREEEDRSRAEEEELETTAAAAT